MSQRPTAALVSAVLLLAGAAPATQPARYLLRCRISNAAKGCDMTPTLEVIAGQTASFTVGGEAPSPRPGHYVEYGTRLDAWLAAPAADGTIAVDLTLSRTDLTDVRPPGFTVTGATARTVCSVRTGGLVRLSLGDAAGTALDVTVEAR